MRSSILAVAGVMLVAACSDGVAPRGSAAAPGDPTSTHATALGDGPARTSSQVYFEMKAFTYGPNYEVFTAAGCQHTYQQKQVPIYKGDGSTVPVVSLMDWESQCSNVLSDTTGMGGMPYDGGDITVWATAGGPWTVVGQITQAGLQIVTTQSIPSDATVKLVYQLNSGCYFMGWLKDDQAGLLPSTNELVVSVASLQYSQITAQMKCGGSDPNYNPPPQPQDPGGCDPAALICEE
jgi:hypothetical protein